MFPMLSDPAGISDELTEFDVLYGACKHQTRKYEFDESMKQAKIINTAA